VLQGRGDHEGSGRVFGSADCSCREWVGIRVKTAEKTQFKGPRPRVVEGFKWDFLFLFFGTKIITEYFMTRYIYIK
jgi:hypothetical protein